MEGDRGGDGWFLLLATWRRDSAKAKCYFCRKFNISHLGEVWKIIDSNMPKIRGISLDSLEGKLSTFLGEISLDKPVFFHGPKWLSLRVFCLVGEAARCVVFRGSNGD